ncbi:hypothetical protein ACQRUO_38740, partial [Kitasatospora sp. LaBMicrA B282]
MSADHQTPNRRAVRLRRWGRRRVNAATIGAGVAAAAGSVVLGTGYAHSLPGHTAQPPSLAARPVGAATPAAAPTATPSPTRS